MKLMARLLFPKHPTRSGERGYALLGLLLALSIMSIFLVSSVAPDVAHQVRRDKEAEMIYRGNQMAKAIARYYGRNQLAALQIQFPPPYGRLLELKKLEEGVTMGVQQIKFARASEMIDPLTNVEWEPVRARDPRIAKFLQAYASATGWQITPQYELLANAPVVVNFKPTNPADGDSSSAGDGQTGGQSGTQTGQPTSPNQQPGVHPPAKNKDDEDDDDDDDDDTNGANDPLKSLFGSGSGSTPDLSTIPIVGVAPKLKGKATLPFYGLDRYEQWVFIFIPDPSMGLGNGTIPNPGGPNPPLRRLPSDGGSGGGTLK